MEELLGKLKASIETGNYYEAHQMYRSVYRRLCKQKKYAQARDLLQTGAREFFCAKQTGSAMDLSQLLVADLFPLMDQVVNIDSCSSAIELLLQFPPEDSARADFIIALQKWTGKYGSCTTGGEPAVNFILAEMFRREKQWGKAEKYLLMASYPDNAHSLAQMVINDGNAVVAFKEELSVSSNRTALLYVILKCLSVNRLNTASLIFQDYVKYFTPETVSTEMYHGINLPIYTDSLLNAAQYFILACRGKEGRLFSLLKHRHESMITENLLNGSVLIDKIGQVHFGLASQRQPQMNLNALLGSIFGNNNSGPSADHQLD